MEIMDWKKADTVAVDTYLKEYHKGGINTPNSQGYSPLLLALFHKAPSKTIKILLDKGADPNFTDKTGLINTREYAEKYCNKQVCDLLNE